ncbi:AAA family ATPase [Fibrella aquatilis]|uniref:AAA family ATPase n=1 Tax=Fibrella aquatilis TaxID=2817059 RepID=A0A939JZ19_9BACT|nr:ATP-binding protein [Fibrella aquatilis]MBO0932694.1 AAA family ATPase [Fibrella aquatilis]
MLIRVSITNFKSFNEETEFNMLAASDQRRHKEHVYSQHGVDLLKMAAIYGANGAGKSNLVKAVSLIRDVVVRGGREMLSEVVSFKLGTDNKDIPTTIEIEFIKNNQTYIYGLSIDENLIIEEWLYKSGLGIKNDELLFTRKKIEDRLVIDFPDEYLSTDEEKFRAKFFQEELLKDNMILLKELSSLKAGFEEIKKAYSWFKENLVLLSPRTRLATDALAAKLDSSASYVRFSNELLSSFSTGIHNIRITNEDVDDTFKGEERQRLIDVVKPRFDEGESFVAFFNHQEWTRGNEVVIIPEGDKLIIRNHVSEHRNLKGDIVDFSLDEESDGTNRLLDFIPAFYAAIHAQNVILIDEIDQSIHPTLLKKLVRKFADDPTTKGQLIFTTHESNLLDQDIFRRDEIWFAEKHEGATKLYPLSDFDIRFDLDIRKGYLNGRFGAIPFLGNLADLNWDQYAEA